MRYGLRIEKNNVSSLTLLPLTRNCGAKPERGYDLGLEDVAISRECFVDSERRGERGTTIECIR